MYNVLIYKYKCNKNNCIRYESGIFNKMFYKESRFR